jgi:membrane-bound lytic murein transglycosylase A
LALRKITDLRELPDFTAACRDLLGLKQAVANSLHYLAKPSSQQFFPYGQITHEQAVASLQAFEAMLDTGMTPEQLNAAIRSRFDVYTSVGWDGSGTVWFTGYYTPIFNGSLTPTDRYRYPLYKEPTNLVKTADGTVLGRRTADGSIVPCPTRAGAVRGTGRHRTGVPGRSL